MNRVLNIRFGALCKPITVQLAEQGVNFYGNRSEKSTSARHFQRDADAITRLSLRGFMSAAAARNARKKLLGRISKQVG